MKNLLKQVGVVLHSPESAAEEAQNFPARAGKMWREQELWEHRVTKTAQKTIATAAQHETARDFDFTSTEIVREREVQSASKRKNAVCAAYAVRRAGLRSDKIARFLQVNQSVQGGDSFVYRVIQAARGVSADYDLWKGPTRQVTFLLG